MRAILFTVFVTVASVASAQYPGGYEVWGPFQPSAYGGFYQANHSVPPYRGPLALQYGIGYDYESYATARELRLIRWQLEDTRLRRRVR